MIETFDHVFDRFFDEPNCQIRWEKLKAIFGADHASFRVLFMVETAALIDKWAEPAPEDLNRILQHKLGGGLVAAKIGDIINLMQPVWPLEMAKFDVQIYRTLSESELRKRYPFTSIRCFATALVQTWWAFEIMMNDFAGIILAQRTDKISASDRQLLLEVRPKLDKAGRAVEEPYYQPVLDRVQFIYRVLTGEEMDRTGERWRHLVELKEIRDTYVHRLGKDGDGGSRLGDESVVMNGFAAVASVIKDVFAKTPEFSSGFVYRFLAFWSCDSDSPFVWDGNEGGSFYVGLAGVRKESLVSFFAPEPGSFGPPTAEIAEALANRKVGEA